MAAAQTGVDQQDARERFVDYFKRYSNFLSTGQANEIPAVPNNEALGIIYKRAMRAAAEVHAATLYENQGNTNAYEKYARYFGSVSETGQITPGLLDENKDNALVRFAFFAWVAGDNYQLSTRDIYGGRVRTGTTDRRGNPEYIIVGGYPEARAFATTVANVIRHIESRGGTPIKDVTTDSEPFNEAGKKLMASVDDAVVDAANVRSGTTRGQSAPRTDAAMQNIALSSLTIKGFPNFTPYDAAAAKISAGLGNGRDLPMVISRREPPSANASLAGAQAAQPQPSSLDANAISVQLFNATRDAAAIYFDSRDPKQNPPQPARGLPNDSPINQAYLSAIRAAAEARAKKQCGEKSFALFAEIYGSIDPVTGAASKAELDSNGDGGIFPDGENVPLAERGKKTGDAMELTTNATRLKQDPADRVASRGTPEFSEAHAVAKIVAAYMEAARTGDSNKMPPATLTETELEDLRYRVHYAIQGELYKDEHRDHQVRGRLSWANGRSVDRGIVSLTNTEFLKIPGSDFSYPYDSVALALSLPMRVTNAKFPMQLPILKPEEERIATLLIERIEAMPRVVAEAAPVLSQRSDPFAVTNLELIDPVKPAEVVGFPESTAPVVVAPARPVPGAPPAPVPPPSATAVPPVESPAVGTPADRSAVVAAAPAPVVSVAPASSAVPVTPAPVAAPPMPAPPVVAASAPAVPHAPVETAKSAPDMVDRGIAHPATPLPAAVVAGAIPPAAPAPKFDIRGEAGDPSLPFPLPLPPAYVPPPVLSSSDQLARLAERSDPETRTPLSGKVIAETAQAVAGIRADEAARVAAAAAKAVAEKAAADSRALAAAVPPPAEAPPVGPQDFSSRTPLLPLPANMTAALAQAGTFPGLPSMQLGEFDIRAKPPEAAPAPVRVAEMGGRDARPAGEALVAAPIAAPPVRQLPPLLKANLADMAAITVAIGAPKQGQKDWIEVGGDNPEHDPARHQLAALLLPGLAEKATTEWTADERVQLAARFAMFQKDYNAQLPAGTQKIKQDVRLGRESWAALTRESFPSVSVVAQLARDTALVPPPAHVPPPALQVAVATPPAVAPVSAPLAPTRSVAPPAQVPAATPATTAPAQTAAAATAPAQPAATARLTPAQIAQEREAVKRWPALGDPEYVGAVQVRLQLKGLYQGRIDRDPGPATLRAIEKGLEDYKQPNLDKLLEHWAQIARAESGKLEVAEGSNPATPAPTPGMATVATVAVLQ